MGKFLHSFFSPLGFRHAVPQVWDGFQTNIRLMVIAELLVLVFALVLAIVRVVPPLLNDFIGLQKDTAIITVIGVTDALAQAGFYSSDYFLYVGYTVAATFFVILTIPFARFTDRLIKQRERRERAQLV